MKGSTLQRTSAAVWALVERQHGVVARWQLLELGFSAKAIDHRISIGRLHVIHRGAYAVGRPDITDGGRWMAAVLACGPGATLSHESAAELWGIRPTRSGPAEISVPERYWRRCEGVVIHRRSNAVAETMMRDGIPVTTVVRTLVDLALRLRQGELEAAINQADKLDLIDPDALRSSLDPLAGQPGVRSLRATLDLRTFSLTRSELERRFLPIARRVGLPKPETCVYRNGFEVDFYWPDLRLVVETDGLRYHRTPAQQARDSLRNHAHQVAGDNPLRFTHAQVRYEPRHVEATLKAVVRNLHAVRLQR